MKNTILLVICFISLNINAQTDKAEIINALDTFFEGLRTTDTLKIRLVCSPDFAIQSIMRDINKVEYK